MRLSFKIIIVLFLCFGCRKNINLNIPDKPPMLVVNGILKSDSVIQLHITSSVKALSNQPIRIIKDAQVLVTGSNQTQMLTHTNDGYYLNTSATAYSGMTYFFQISAPGFNSVNALVTMPLSPVIDTLYYTVGANNYFKLKLFINDPANARNCYKLCLSQTDTGGFKSKIYLSYTRNNNSIYEESENLFFESEGCIYFSDELFNGKKIEQTADFYPLTLTDSVTSAVKINGTLQAEVSSITQDYFLYKRSLLKYYQTVNNPFAEPVNVYSNINNGIGIIGAQTTLLRIIR